MPERKCAFSCDIFPKFPAALSYILTFYCEFHFLHCSWRGPFQPTVTDKVDVKHQNLVLRLNFLRFHLLPFKGICGRGNLILRILPFLANSRVICILPIMSYQSWWIWDQIVKCISMHTAIVFKSWFVYLGTSSVYCVLELNTQETKSLILFPVSLILLGKVWFWFALLTYLLLKCVAISMSI